MNKFTLFMKMLVLGSDLDILQTFLEDMNLQLMREMPAYGMEIFTLDLNIDGLDVKFQIWKANISASFTMGKEYLFPADGILLIFNKTDAFEHVNGWIEEIWKKDYQSNIPLALYSLEPPLKDKESENKLKNKIEKLTVELSQDTSSKGYYLRYFEFQDQTLENRMSVVRFLGQQIIQSSPRAITHYKNEVKTAITEAEKLTIASKKHEEKLLDMKEELEAALTLMSNNKAPNTSEEQIERFEELEDWKEEVKELEKEFLELNRNALKKEKEVILLEKTLIKIKISHKKAIKETKEIIRNI